MSKLISPHGGTLINLCLPDNQVEQELAHAKSHKTWVLTHRQVCDLELLISGGFSPLTGFMTQADYESVVHSMRLTNNTLWPIPITLDVNETFANEITPGDSIALRHPNDELLAILDISDKWVPNKSVEAEKVFGADDLAHPGVAYLHQQAGNVYIGGKLKGINTPSHNDFKHLHNTPAELRAKFEEYNWERIVAFQTRNPMHRAHQELTFRAAQQANANLLIHPVVGITKPGDIDAVSRIRCYQHVLDQYPPDSTMLSLLPLAMRMAGPREAVWHAIIRKNYGCTHFIVGRDHAGPGSNSQGEDFYGAYDAQEMVAQYKDDLGIEMIPFQTLVYVKEKAKYLPLEEVDTTKHTVLSISGTEFRRRLREGLEIPEWFTYPKVVEELRKD